MVKGAARLFIALIFLNFPAQLEAEGGPMAPRVGFEPTTSRLTVGCSTTELPRIRAHRRRAYSSLLFADASARKKRARRTAGLCEVW